MSESSAKARNCNVLSDTIDNVANVGVSDRSKRMLAWVREQITVAFSNTTFPSGQYHQGAPAT